MNAGLMSQRDLIWWETKKDSDSQAIFLLASVFFQFLNTKTKISTACSLITTNITFTNRFPPQGQPRAHLSTWYKGAINFTKMSFIRIMSLYYCRRIVSFITDVETFIVTYVPGGVTALPVVTYVAYVLCAVMLSSCISTFGVHIVIESNIGVRTIVRSNKP